LLAPGIKEVEVGVSSDQLLLAPIELDVLEHGSAYRVKGTRSSRQMKLDVFFRVDCTA